MRLDELDGILPPGDEITLYRIVQECLNNILKHSGATKAEIKIVVDAGELALNDPRQWARLHADEGNVHGRAGLGLQGIAERVRILGGTHAIQSAPGQRHDRHAEDSSSGYETIDRIKLK